MSHRLLNGWPGTMAQIFSPRANLVAWLSIATLLVLIVGVTLLMFAFQRSTYATRVDMEVSQPVPFSHAHHVGGLGIDCRYCHSAVEDSSFAGMPSTDTCMTCHSDIYTDAEMLEPIRESHRTGEPIRWQRVNNLPDFVYFDHSIHVNKGVGCTTCHGDVDQMPLMEKVNTNFMKWCLDCHRAPAENLRPADEIFSVTWERPADWSQQGEALMREYHIERTGLTDCTICHR